MLCGVLQQSEVFRSLPIHEIPVHPKDQFGADQCIQKLAVQEQGLKHFADRNAPLPKRVEDLENLRAKLRAAIDQYKIDECSAKIGLNCDTLRDFAGGRIRRPRGRTAEKLEEYFRQA